jgi:hypothetical protein
MKTLRVRIVNAQSNKKPSEAVAPEGSRVGCAFPIRRPPNRFRGEIRSLPIAPSVSVYRFGIWRCLRLTSRLVLFGIRRSHRVNLADGCPFNELFLARDLEFYDFQTVWSVGFLPLPRRVFTCLNPLEHFGLVVLTKRFFSSGAFLLNPSHCWGFLNCL